ncbi:hypothetical protein GOP47_0004975 [Adiantum capillus-veneris]|uniref:ATP-dependent DNA helicase 2 subunit KU80 n=1 Tax=Adiantum capillus-veneris TaxID=13818 RepID=A0A9D4ZN73_ADICA|nr:hypothetical protein GOP47_0004975 [Adiantum capillus-veneris]
MARNKETAVILLDVSPSMHPYLKHVARAASTLVQRKMIFSKYDEVGLVIFGVSEASNELYEELGGYEHVSVLRHIQVVDDDILKILDDLPEGSELGDYLDAIVVGMDMLIKKAGPGKKGNKHIFLITDGESFVKDSAEDETKEDQVDKLAVQLTEHGMKLDAVVMRTKRGPNKSKVRTENEFLLKRFAGRPQVEVAFVDSPTSLLGAIKPRNVTPVTLYRGDLELTPNMTMKVWVYKKVSEERLPTLKKYSDKAPRGVPHASHEVKMDIEYKSTEDPDKTVPPDQRTKAYRYGPQLVPISSVVEDALKLKTEKGVKLIGFTDTTNVSRHYYMKESNIFIPEPGNMKSIVAMSALARAMKELNKVAIVRCVWRQGQSGVVIGVLTPYIPMEENFPVGFYFNILPFMEDAREFPFTSLDTLPSNMQPSVSQQEAADNFVKLFDLAPKDHEERLLPERTLNPILQRWYCYLHNKHMNAGAEVPPLDDALRPVVEPDQELLTENEFIIKRFNNQFTLKVNEEKGKRSSQFWKEKELDENARGEEDSAMDDVSQISFDSLTARRVSEVGSIQPVQDFEAMLARRDSDEWVPKAIREMKKLIVDLLDSAYKGNTYDKSMACLTALRKGCVEQGEPSEFNCLLRDLGNKCCGKRHNDFWDLVLDRRLTLINKDEAPDSDVSEEEALAFLNREGPIKAAEEPVEEEEIDEMEALLGEAV